MPPKIYDEPLLWLPKEADNSAGGQVWVPKDQWGALGGKMLHLSYGRCKAYAILPDGDKFQAGAVDLGLTFLSGSARARFNPIDKHLYVVGLNGWQTAAKKDGCLQRVRYTGKPYPFPIAFRVHAQRRERNLRPTAGRQECCQPIELQSRPVQLSLERRIRLEELVSVESEQRRDRFGPGDGRDAQRRSQDGEHQVRHAPGDAHEDCV